MAHRALPNLSGLKLSGAEDETGAVQFDVDPAHYNEDEYHEGLYGEPAMRAVAASIENNEIIASIRPQPMYETFPAAWPFTPCAGGLTGSTPSTSG